MSSASSGDELITALIQGNNYASKFTVTQATDFDALWDVVDQLPNATYGYRGAAGLRLSTRQRGKARCLTRPFSRAKTRRGSYSLNLLQQAAETLGLKAGIKQASVAHRAHLPLPCLAVLKPASVPHPVPAANESIAPTTSQGGDAAPQMHRLALVLKANDTRVLLFDEKSKNPFEAALSDFALQYSGQVILFQARSKGVIGRSIQLIAGCTGQDYNRRKGRQGAYWEDRYHATAVDADDHLQRCLVYIDLNMVRAGAVAHPRDWDASGYREIQAPRERYAIIDVAALSALCGFRDIARFQDAHRRWIEQALLDGADARDPRWSEAIAVSRRSFVEKIQVEIGLKAKYRDVSTAAGTYRLREPAMPYRPIFGPKSDVLSLKNGVVWERTLESTEI